MAFASSTKIRAIVFDLDGTLYVAPDFAATIQNQAAVYMGRIKGVSVEEARRLIAATRRRLTDELGSVQTLSAVCIELGGNIRELHALFQERLRPEACLVRDERVIGLLRCLRERFHLYIYTNNNHAITSRILDYLGLGGLFTATFAIDDTWRAKPDEEILGKVLAAIRQEPAQVLFVGDRYDVDLRLPEQKGCPVFLSRNVEQLLRLEELLA